MTFEPGQRIGVYRIVRLLGEGGMGVVYEVEHERLGVRYALKTFTTQNAHADILKRKFLAEGKILARLRHPHLIRVFDLDVDEATGVPYFVMDVIAYKDGSPHSLCDIERDDLDEDYILSWFEDLCNALDYIHSQGIVHRDIKLGNVLLYEDKHVMLSDFGVLRVLGDELAHELDVTKTIISDGRTGVKLVMGTQGYMAPEVRRGQDATPAADVYSLGVMFFYLLTGIWYESGTRALELLDNFKYRWQDVLPQMLSVNPAERPLPLSKLSSHLQLAVPFDETSQVTEKPTVSPKRKWIVAAVACGLVAALVTVSAFALLRSRDNGFPIPVQDDFGELFSSSDLFRSTGDGK